MATKTAGVHQLTQVMESLDEQIGALIQARALLLEEPEPTGTRKPRASKKAPLKKATPKPRGK